MDKNGQPSNPKFLLFTFP